MKKIILISCALLFSILLSACATIMSGSTERLHVQAIDEHNQPISTAKCHLTDGKGNTYAINSNPGSAVVSRGNGAIQTHCSAAGYTQKSTGVGTSFNAWTLVNILFWPGLIVDGLSGAYSKYPDHITVIMHKN